MSRYSVYIRQRIVSLSQRGLSIRAIRTTLLAEDGLSVSLGGVSKFLNKVRNGSSLVDLPRAGRSSKITAQVKDIIDRELERNGELSAADLQNSIARETGNMIPLSTLRRARRKLGWVHTGTRYCQLIRDANRPKRLEFAQRCLANADTFDDVVWSDESSIKIERHAKKAFRKTNMPVPSKENQSIRLKSTCGLVFPCEEHLA